MVDLITGGIPCAEDITGVRIVDKSRGSEPTIRLEVWLAFPEGHNDQRGIDIRNHILDVHFAKAELPRNHNDVAKSIASHKY